MGAVVLGRLTEVPKPRLVGWTVLVTVLAALSYAANLADSSDPPDDLLYRWSSAVGGLIQYAIILGVVLAIARGIAPATLGLVRPDSWRWTAARLGMALAAIWVIGAVLNIFLQAGKEQGLVPNGWDPGRAAPFVANFVVVVGVAPVVEELTYRGLGFAAVRDSYGTGAAVVVTALAFGLAHGLFVALPVLTIFGLILAWLRLQTGSIYPTIMLHALFNGVALLAAVAM